MLQAKKIRALLNGGAAAAGVDGLRAAVDAIAAEIAVHKREIVEIPKLRGEAALADDGEARCAALTARETELCAAIEVAEIRIARLREKLAEQINIRRRDRIEHHRLTAREKFEALASALRAAVEANEAATSAFSEACFELGVADATSLISRGDYLPPGAVVRAMVDHWQRVIRHELDVASQTAPRSPTKQTPVSTVATVATISHGDPGRGPVFLRQILSPGGKLAAERARAAAGGKARGDHQRTCAEAKPAVTAAIIGKARPWFC